MKKRNFIQLCITILFVLLLAVGCNGKNNDNRVDDLNNDNTNYENGTNANNTNSGTGNDINANDTNTNGVNENGTITGNTTNGNTASNTGTNMVNTGNNNATNTNVKNQTTSNGTNSPAEGIIHKYVTMIGNDDAAVTKVLGEGSKTTPAGGKNLTSREYQETINGEEFTVSLRYDDDNNKVDDIYIYLTDTNMDLAGWSNYLTGELGDIDHYESDVWDADNENESGISSISWIDDGSVVSLYDSNGVYCIKIEPLED